jgi:hypothetical protein
MQDAFLGATWAGQVGFSSESLCSLHDLNRRFLDLAGSRADDWQVLSSQLAPLTTVQRAAAAACPYALFDLCFHDGDHWQARFAGAEPWRIADEPVADPEIARFAQLALLFAWHLATTSRLAAQLMLGMSERTVIAFNGVTMARLTELAAGEARFLKARWRDSGLYWGALVHAVSRADAINLRRVQLFGLQLAGAARLSTSV